MATPIASLYMFNLDCTDPHNMAVFYAAVLGWDITYDEAEYAMVSSGNTRIGFGRVEDYTPPAWPGLGVPKQYHLDLEVDDMAQAEAACSGLGAAIPDFQPGGGRWRVLIDPAGHPFCLVGKQPAS